MNRYCKGGVAFLAVVLVAGLVLTFSPVRPALGEAQAPGNGVPKYTVVATDGTHLVVTDNGAGKVYFYAIEQDGKPGDELKLRGSLNLNDVGKPGLTPTKGK
jgi:hypothetical protein